MLLACRNIVPKVYKVSPLWQPLVAINSSVTVFMPLPLPLAPLERSSEHWHLFRYVLSHRLTCISVCLCVWKVNSHVNLHLHICIYSSITLLMNCISMISIFHLFIYISSFVLVWPFIHLFIYLFVLVSFISFFIGIFCAFLRSVNIPKPICFLPLQLRPCIQALRPSVMLYTDCNFVPIA